MVRILEGAKKISSKEASFYDNDILTALSKEPQKLQKLFTTLFGKMKVHTGDVFLVRRIKELINDNKIEIIGDWKTGWKDIILKKAGSSNEAEKPELRITV